MNEYLIDTIAMWVNAILVFTGLLVWTIGLTVAFFYACGWAGRTIRRGLSALERHARRPLVRRRYQVIVDDFTADEPATVSQEHVSRINRDIERRIVEPSTTPKNHSG